MTPEMAYEGQDLEFHKAEYIKEMTHKIHEAQENLFIWLENLSFQKCIKGAYYTFNPKIEVLPTNIILAQITLKKFTKLVMQPFKECGWEVVPTQINPDEIQLLIGIDWWQ